MNKYNEIRAGHEIVINPVHYGYNSKTSNSDNQSLIWVNVYSKTVTDDFGGFLRIGGGYIDNLFPNEYFGTQDNFDKSIKLEGVLSECYFMESSNGGRGNPNQYSSIEEYIKDPLVKQRFNKRQFNRFDFSDCGDPERVDLISRFRIQEPFEVPRTFELKERIWEDVVPLEWYSEAHSSTVERLSKTDSYENAQEAIESTSVEDDLFGSRLFPVLKAPKELMDKMKEICEDFKSYSKVLMDDQFIYIGIRSKEHEIDTINDIYENGGTILKDTQWDW
jgi:hypothetical protein